MDPFRHDPAMDAPQDNGRGNHRPRRSRSELRRNFLQIRDPHEGATIRFAFSSGGPYGRARIFTLPAQLVAEIFPRIDAHGARRRFQYEGAFIVDHFLAESLLRQTPPDELVQAYHSLFEHILSGNPRQSLYRRLERREGGIVPRSVEEIGRQMMAMAQLLSSPRGFGCDGWLLEHFASACGQLFQDGLDSWSIDQRKWCFIHILEAFIDALTPSSRVGDAASCQVLEGIWGGLGEETQRAVETKINEEASRDQALGRRLRIALNHLFARMDMARRPRVRWQGLFGFIGGTPRASPGWHPRY